MSIDWNKSDRTPFPSVTGCLCGLLVPSVLTHLRSQPEGSLSLHRSVSLCLRVEWVDKSSNVLDPHIGDVWVVLHGERRNSPQEWAPGARSGHLLAHPLFMGGLLPRVHGHISLLLAPGVAFHSNPCLGSPSGENQPKTASGNEFAWCPFLASFLSPSLSGHPPLPHVFNTSCVHTQW